MSRLPGSYFFDTQRLRSHLARFIEAWIIACTVAACAGTAIEQQSGPSYPNLATSDPVVSHTPPVSMAPTPDKVVAAVAEPPAPRASKKTRQSVKSSALDSERGLNARTTPTQKRPAIRHILAFYAPVIKVYKEPYGHEVQLIPDRAFPRQQLSDGRSGVAVFASSGSFVEVALPGGETGWVLIDLVSLSAVPCALNPKRSREPNGPGGAASAAVDCVRQ